MVRLGAWWVVLSLHSALGRCCITHRRGLHDVTSKIDILHGLLDLAFA